MKNILLIILLFVSLIGYSQNRYHIDEVTTQSDTLTFLIKDSSSVNGVVFELYENGQLKDEKYYKDGKPDGLERRWNEDGQLTHEWEITEIDGKEVSSFKLYENGQEILFVNFDEDGDISSFQSWYENGQLEQEMKLVEKTDLLDREWYENGQLKKECEYKDDEIIYQKCWDEDGNEIECED
tara:strand:+ start:809 stop:1354 length:546 start_codon:yes stop_codon:yes gene_type:complete